MFNESQAELKLDVATPNSNDEQLVQTAAIESEMAELSDSDLDNVSGGFSFGDLGSFFQESGSFFSETNIFFEQTTFAGRDGAGGKTTFIMQAIDTGSTESAGGFMGSPSGN